MKLMDVTLRESVYYGSGIDYEAGLDYLKKIDSFITPEEVEYIEICYVNTSINGHLNYNADYIRKAYDICKGKFKLVAMMHPDSADKYIWNPDVIRLLSMVRIVCGGETIPENVKDFVEYLHNLGVEVSINISFALRKSFEKNDELCRKCVEYGADYIYFADSSGSAYGEDIDALCSILNNNKANRKTGFHLHDHLSLAFANALRAYENKIDITDISITGAGRGGGNLKTEFFIPYLKKASGEKLSIEMFDRLLDYIEYFNVLVHRDGAVYKQLYLDSLSGIFRLGLKQQESIERRAIGSGHKYIKYVLEDLGE
ncbi:MAG: hypothetical protein IJ706_07520 [Clostridia bacterium]|nr:hypothetical protein [Clostridia bacterium]